MKNLSKFLLTLFVSSFILVSCSEDDNGSGPNTNNDVIADYFPTTEGSWWKYESWTTDENGNKVNKTSDDSTYYNGTTTIGGKLADILKTEYSDEFGNWEDEQYFHVEEKRLWNWTEGDEDLGFGDMWMKAVDFENDTWDITSNEVGDAEVFGVPVSNARFDLTGRKAQNQSILIKGTNYDALVYYIEITMSGEAAILGPIAVPVQVVQPSAVWAVKGIGLVKQTVESPIIRVNGQEVTVQELFGEDAESIPGSESVLIDYNISE